MRHRSILARTLVVTVSLVLLAACAAQQAYQRAEKHMRREAYDRAVLDYSKALALKPGHPRYSVALERAKIKAAGDHLEKGKRYAAAQRWDLAIAEYQQALLLNPGHQFAATELEKAIREMRRQQLGPSEIEQLKDRARRADLGPPRLDPRTNIPILLGFNDVEVGKIFEAIGKASGINFIFDEKVDLDKPMTIDIGNVSLEKALDILMLQTKNFYKVIDDYTLLVAPDTRQKRQEYEDQVIRTFFLSNADTKQVVTLLRSLLQSRQIAENTDLNSVTIKDTPDKVAIAERIISANDKSKGEVLIDVELMEINRTVTKTLGIDLSSKTLSLTFRDGMAAPSLNNLESLNQAGNWTVGVIPSVVLSFLRSDSDTNSIAQPQLRVSEGEQAEILIGDRVPIPTTSFNTSQTIGGNIVPITSFTYQNVGITVQIEPRVHHNREVTLRVQVEISQVTGAVETSGGQAQPIIGTRQIQTVIRLRDGETNMLAGLIQRTDTDSHSGLPGLSDVPVLRRIFGSNSTNLQETDIVMTLTPRIIRIPDITEQDLATLWVGTEENMRLRGPARNALNQSPFSTDSRLFAEAPSDTPPPGTERRGRGTLQRMAPSPEEPAGARGLPQPPPRSDPRGAPGAQADAPDGALDDGPYLPPPGVGVDVDEEPDLGEPPDDAFEGEPEDERDLFDDDDEDDDFDPEPDEPPGVAAVRLVSSESTFRVGDQVDVQVMLENGSNVGSVPFHLRYNPAVLRYVPPAAEGPFLKQDGMNTVFLSNDSAGGGEIVVGLSRMGAAEGASGSGVLALFRFEAIAPGDAGFAFTGASVKDPTAGNLPAGFSTMAVRVEP